MIFAQGPRYNNDMSNKIDKVGMILNASEILEIVEDLKRLSEVSRVMGHIEDAVAYKERAQTLIKRLFKEAT